MVWGVLGLGEVECEEDGDGEGNVSTECGILTDDEFSGELWIGL